MYKLETASEEFNLLTEVWMTGLEGIKEKLEKADIEELKRVYKQHGFRYSELNGKVTKERLIERMMRFVTHIKQMDDNIYEAYGEGVRKQLMQIYD